MVKKIVLVAVLLGAGVAIALYLRNDTAPTAEPLPAFKPQSGASPEVRIADLERALAAQIERARAQDARIAQLEARLGQGGFGGRRGDGEGRQPNQQQLAEMRERFGVELGPDGRPDPASLRERQRERQLQRFTEAGFTRDRAEWIERRVEELEVQAMQAQYEAQRSGRQAQGVDAQRLLRAEIGDAEYERYLTATGQPTEVQIMDVLASSAAERSGLQPGDQVLSYGGTRVFDMRELNALTREGSPGESVTVEVRRNGQTVQVQVPRGPLGVSGGGFRRGGGGPPGGPARQGGGFRGGGGFGN